MKEFSIEQKAQAYDGLIERLKDLKFAYRFSPLSDTIEEKFPELKESEDERIRQAIIEHFAGSHSSMYPYKGFTKEQILAWLEKQGEQNNDKIVEKAKTQKQRVSLTETDGSASIDWDCRSLDDVKTLLRCGLEFIRTIEANKQILSDSRFGGCSSHIPTRYDKGIKQGEQKPADKVEPKFKVGDWVVNNNGEPQFFQVTFYSWPDSKIKGKDNLELFINSATLDKQYHLWTIQDAKDGDVLAYPDGSITMFNYMTENLYMAHVLWVDGHIELNNSCAISNVHPATKEQRDTLIKAMADAGYEWDAEKKELKKVEQNPVWSEEEDDTIIKRIIDELKEKKSIGVLGKTSYDIMEKWLNALRHKKWWKPSDEQMKALEDSIEFLGCTKKVRDDLKSLYWQLKKLEEK